MPGTVTSYGTIALANFVVKQQRHSYGTQSYDSGGVMQTRPVCVDTRQSIEYFSQPADKFLNFKAHMFYALRLWLAKLGLLHPSPTEEPLRLPIVLIVGHPYVTSLCFRREMDAKSDLRSCAVSAAENLGIHRKTCFMRTHAIIVLH